MNPLIEQITHEWNTAIEKGYTVWKSPHYRIIGIDAGIKKLQYIHSESDNVVRKDSQLAFRLWSQFFTLGRFRDLQPKVSINEWNEMVNSLEVV
jgi:hypothetical protein